MFKDKLMKLGAGKEMNPMEKDVKTRMLQKIKKDAVGVMNDSMDILPGKEAAVKVEADSPEGLEEGLEHAKQIISPEGADITETEEESSEDLSTPEAIDAKIMELLELKKKMQEDGSEEAPTE